MNSDPYNVYVTVGHSTGRFPIIKKVCMLVYEDIGETPVQVAKKLRKQVADNAFGYGYVLGTVFKPSELYYEVYINVDAKMPYAESTNSPRLYRESNNG